MAAGNMNKIGLYSIVFSLLLGTFFAFHQNVALAQTVAPNQGCTQLSHNLRYGSTDYLTSGDVTKLQVYLNRSGYFPYTPVGIFGTLTYRSVQAFQAAHGLPASGYVGPLTRSLIQQTSCSNIIPPPQQALSLQTLSPGSGSPGAQVTIYGNGFTSDNTVYFGPTVVGRIASYNGSSISFIVPTSAYVGAYEVIVQNSNGISNKLIFTVQQGGQNRQQPVISTVTGPTQLAIGQVGTWSIQASSNGQELSYGVNWGDASADPSYGYSNPYANTVSSGTFTHAYNNPGTYNPTFTVTDQYGNTAKASASVVVAYSQQNSLSPIVIKDSGSTNSHAFALTINTDGSASLNVTNSGSRQFPSGTFDYRGLLNKIQAVPTLSFSSNCMKSASFGTSIWVEYNGTASGDLTCVPTGASYQDLAANVNSIINMACPYNSCQLGSNVSASTVPSISSISRSSGPVGTMVTVYGSGFTSDNKINLLTGASGNVGGNAGQIAEVASNDGQTLSFTIPTNWTHGQGCDSGPAYCQQVTEPLTPGIYHINISTNGGVSNDINFTVNSSSQDGALQISYLSPSSGSVGSTVTIYGSGFTATNNTVTFREPSVFLGTATVSNLSSSDGNTLSFTVPSNFNVQDLCSDISCPSGGGPIGTGVYTVTVQNGNYINSNSLNFTVTSGATRRTL